ncbi:MAG TPA: hypothetical protein VF507_08120, partial [Pyrinomonadaceae bacterium]
MFNSFPLRVKLISRAALLCSLSAALFATTGCATLFGVKRKVGVPPLLTPLASADTEQLVEEVNRASGVRSLRGKIDLQFQDTSFAESGIAEKYRTAEASLILQRPGQIFLAIQGPFSVDIAQMTSDGEHFRVAVLKGDEKYRRFLRGTNNAAYGKLSSDSSKDGRARKDRTMTEERTVSALSNLRPQHFTDALLIRPIRPRSDSGLVYAQSEFYQEEADTRTRPSA